MIEESVGDPYEWLIPNDLIIPAELIELADSAMNGYKIPDDSDIPADSEMSSADSVKPTDSEIPAGSEMSSADLVKPTDSDEIPADSVIPVGSEMPTDSIIPADDSEMPATDSVIPADSVVPTDSVIPADSEIYANSIMSVESAITVDSEPVDLEYSVEKKIPRKKKFTRVSYEQKELIINFIIKHPELITHSTTKENQKQLWNDLYVKLNDHKSDRDFDGWKNYISSTWKKNWKHLLNKPESSLNVIEYKFKEFLKKLIPNNNDQLHNSQGNLNLASTRSLTRPTLIKEISEKIIEIEKERSSLWLEVDHNEIRIQTYRLTIDALEKSNKRKRAKLRKLSESKAYLNKKKRRLSKNYEESEIEIKKEIESEDSQEQIDF